MRKYNYTKPAQARRIVALQQRERLILTLQELVARHGDKAFYEVRQGVKRSAVQAFARVEREIATLKDRIAGNNLNKQS